MLMDGICLLTEYSDKECILFAAGTINLEKV